MSLEQFDEQKDQVAVEQILRVVFLDVERPGPVSDISHHHLFFMYIFSSPSMLSMAIDYMYWLCREAIG